MTDTLATLSSKANNTGIPAAFAALKAHLPALAVFAEEAKLEKAGTLWNNYGYHLWMIADYAGARAAYERAIKIDEANLGAEHPNVAIGVNNLGSVMKALGDLAGARAAFERALKIDEAAFGAEHPNVARDIHNLGMLFDQMGDKENAVIYEKRALVILEKFLPPEHPSIKVVQGNLDSLGEGSSTDS